MTPLVLRCATMKAATTCVAPGRVARESELPMPPHSSTTKPTLSERLWKRVDKSGGADACWPWLGATNNVGYGVIGVGSKKDGTRGLETTHRLAFQLAHGKPFDGLVIMHTCDNPPCCNPAHLHAGSYSDNQQDSIRKGRKARRRPTHCVHGHPFDEANTYFYRGRRQCRECKKQRKQIAANRPGQASDDPILDSAKEVPW